MNKTNKDRKGFSVQDFLVGFLAGTLLTLIVLIVGKVNFSGVTAKDGSSQAASETSEDTEADTEEVKDYDTSAKDFKVELSNGKTVTLHTPKDFYNLTEMYADDFGSYYGTDIAKYNELMIHVGDANTTYDSKTVVNAAHLDGIKTMMKDLSGDNYNDALVYGEVYNYMKTGKVPKETEVTKNIEIKDLGTFEKDGIKYNTYKLSYDEVAESEKEGTESLEESTEAATSEEPQLVHHESIYGYSDTEDPIEFVVYQEVVDSDKAVALIKEMVGAK